MSWRSQILILVAVTPLLQAQLRFLEIEVGISGLVRPKKPVIADVTATVTAQTPWGPYTQTETGKYWRSSKGQIRQDGEHGLSIVFDLRGERMQARIDYELKVIDRTVRDNDVKFGSYPSVSILDKYSDLKKTGQTVFEGHKVTIRQGKRSDMFYETWSSDELKLILRLFIRVAKTEFEQRFHNIQVTEPSASFFELPPGFRMHTDFTRRLPPESGSGQCRAARRVATGISGSTQQTYEKMKVECEPLMPGSDPTKGQRGIIIDLRR
jgi:hypothetical protein